MRPIYNKQKIIRLPCLYQRTNSTSHNLNGLFQPQQTPKINFGKIKFQAQTKNPISEESKKERERRLRIIKNIVGDSGLSAEEVKERNFHLEVMATQVPEGTFYNMLGENMRINEQVEMEDGTKLTKKDVLLKAVKMNPEETHKDKSFGKNVYCNLADLNEKIQIGDKEMLPIELCLKAIDLSPNDDSIYVQLAKMVKNKLVTFPDGSSANAKDLLIKAIELGSHRAYYDLAKLMNYDETVKLFGKDLDKKDLLIKGLERKVKDPEVFNLLGEILTWKNKTAFIDRKALTPKDLFLRAIDNTRGKPKSKYYLNLAKTMQSTDQTIEFRNGSKMTKDQILSKAIELNPRSSEAYYILSKCCDTKDRLIFNGTVMTRKQLCLKAYGLNPNIRYILPIVSSLTKDETVVVEEKEHKLIDILKQNVDKDSRVYYVLSLISDGPIEINGQTLNEEELLLKSLEGNHNYAYALNRLGEIISPDKIIKLPNRENEYTQRKLFKKAILANPGLPQPYMNLAKLLKDSEGEVIDKKKYTKKQLIQKAIENSMDNNDGYYNALGELVSDAETIEVKNQSLSKKQLFTYAAKFSHKPNPIYYKNLAGTLAADETVSIYGNVLSAQDLIVLSDDLIKNK